MKYWNHYLLPSTVDEALPSLSEASGGARVVAGGTDLLLDIRQGRHPYVDTRVDVTRIPELRVIQSDSSGIYVGSAVTHREITESQLLREHANCLVEACSLIAGPQVRNVATIGGNVAHALTTGDGSIALLAQATGRPVKILFDCHESLLVHPKRHATQIYAKLGAKRDGTLMAAQTELYGDTGAYASLGEKVMTRATTHSTGPYIIPHVRADCIPITRPLGHFGVLE